MWRRALAAAARSRPFASRDALASCSSVSSPPSDAARRAAARRASSSSETCSTSGARDVAPEDTIYALSSAPGRAGVAVIRVSGPAASDVLRLAPRVGGPEGRRPRHREAVPTTFACPDTGETLDRGILLWFDAPRSFTGEDVAELHVHGSLAVVRGILDALARLRPPRVAATERATAATRSSSSSSTSSSSSSSSSRSPSVIRAAEPGEFTRRAFHNDKLDLTQAEGLADLLEAETTAQRRQALSQSGGSLRRRYERWRDALVRSAAHVEATLDFAEDEGVSDDVFRATVPAVASLRDELDEHLRAPPRGELVRRGVRVALVGAPNAGKSSLLNALAGRPAAIVSDHPGTTRDAVEVALELGGYKVIVADTAGVRETTDPVELEGIRRSEAHARDADLTVLVLDAAAEGDAGTLPPWVDRGANLIVRNKMDLPLAKKKIKIAAAAATTTTNATTHALSCETREGLDAFVEALGAAVAARVTAGAGDDANVSAITRSRHRDRLDECVAHLDRFVESARGDRGTPEVAAEELRLAARALGRVTGHVDVEELLDVIFTDFCIGK